MYLEDLVAGQPYGSQEITVDAEGLKSFAMQYDPHHRRTGRWTPVFGQ
jgi:hypothetical protein